jgi:hypothetical protein
MSILFHQFIKMFLIGLVKNIKSMVLLNLLLLKVRHHQLNLILQSSQKHMKILIILVKSYQAIQLKKQDIKCWLN